MQVYLDNATTTRTADEVIEAMLPFFNEKYGLPSSEFGHSMGIDASDALEQSRKTIANYLNVKPNEIVFTSGETESNNLAVLGVARAKGKGHIITTSIERLSILNTCRHLETKGFEITYLPVDKHGLVSPDDLQSAIRDDTILVSVQHANPEIGTVQDIKAIGEICGEHNILFHTDASSSFGLEDLPMEHIDLATFTSHLIHGPKGIASLFVREDITIKPIFFGSNNEFGIRPGFENIPGIVGFAKAVTLLSKKYVEKMRKQRDHIINELTAIPHTYLNGHPEKRLCNNVNVSFSFIEGESVVLHLDMRGIATSTGSACSSPNLKGSYVLEAVGQDPEVSHGSLRLTLSRYTTDREIEYALKHIKDVVSKLREMSPFKDEDTFRKMAKEEHK
ncbi:MAG: cysteine desulfurase [Candidatus Diapherotrites archaeon]|nr:cysteine desulfurase [Candidatus Diapherotrites archaeon]